MPLTSRWSSDMNAADSAHDAGKPPCSWFPRKMSALRLANVVLLPQLGGSSPPCAHGASSSAQYRHSTRHGDANFRKTPCAAIRIGVYEVKQLHAVAQH